MNIEAIKKVYFVGIGGIGMSALARFFKQRGVDVNGYDKTETDLTRTLVQEEIGVTYTDAESEMKKDVDVVIYTPAIPQDNVILNAYRRDNVPVFKRSDALQWITEAMYSITVAGTHGKTTVSTMIGHILRESGYGCNAFLGGISVNYNTNYWSSDNKVAVIEADEYDRSFLKLKPDVAVLTAMDADHLDIYGTAEAVQEAYIQYTENIKPDGILIKKHGLKNGNLLKGAHKKSYSLQNTGADAYADNIQIKNGGYIFDVKGKGIFITGIHLDIGGMHNVENCIAAITVAKQLEIEDDDIKAAVANFKGVKRRFEYIVKNEKVVYIDDYAHHPEELAALIKSAKTLFSKRRIVIAFQPHLYSRTRDFAAEFAHALDMADEVILLDIYPARELPIEGVDAQMIKNKMGNPNVTILSKEGLLSYVTNAPLDLFITAGAGDIDKLVAPIGEILAAK
ncbi:UDP-N-acetylmuramate--L-alanine ligase [Taibaiella sp. KBW10]|uniref:UDP-N-acetylmuramate--L-alanine ligase n=1 Tax=Taibaiella sp. KBW10 TaxID=2153357 RepID=UPI000F5AD2EA|nr:UDP-N-acetylmuramate--L-alanine ligase [Taibaiella sp. KBW10]RQO30457.1 UDP-N-acetylmuramate--L-alanine ligase [Taibaiella sp. KBW10]